MDPEPKQITLILALFSLALVFLYTLARQLYPTLSKHFSPDPKENAFYEKLSKIGNSPHFIETLSFYRVFFIIFGSAMAYQHFQPHPIKVAIEGPRYWVVFPVIAVYFLVGMYIPRTLSLWKSHGLAKPVHLIFSPLWSLTQWSGKLMVQIQKTFYKSVGFNPQLSFLTEEERKQIDIDESEDEEALEDDEKLMIRNIIEFGDTPVQEIMTPRPDIISLDINAKLEDVISLLNKERHSRVPIFNGSIDNISGILHTKDFLEWITKNDKENFSLKQIIRPPILVSHQEKIDDLMRELRLSSNHIAIVVDEYGGTDGIITLEDILEEIVGEIYDEDDERDGRIQQIQDHTWIVQASIELDELMQIIEFPLDIDENLGIETFAGLIQSTIGSQPRKGQKVDIQGLRVKVIKMKDQRIDRVIIEKPIPAED